jgi:hypothetical protein
LRRREFITLLGGAAAAWPLVGHAQQRVMPVVGVLCAGNAQALERYLASFREGMWRLGYVEGSNVRFEFRFADGYLDRLPDLAVELVRLNPHVIVSTPLPAHLAARKATSTIPIVMATGADPVGFGLVASLSHPGGNVTGLANFAEILASRSKSSCRMASFSLTSGKRLLSAISITQSSPRRSGADGAGARSGSGPCGRRLLGVPFLRPPVFFPLAIYFVSTLDGGPLRCRIRLGFPGRNILRGIVIFPYVVEEAN